MNSETETDTADGLTATDRQKYVEQEIRNLTQISTEDVEFRWPVTQLSTQGNSVSVTRLQCNASMDLFNIEAITCARSARPVRIPLRSRGVTVSRYFSACKSAFSL